ncbi:(d)CMP kinase [Roseimarinus sediminis]|jgi:cytidylate kinase|uniref:(d)CMP kinase n=1 Tax=Roseimarinus sediminis TaxID=1610899 RepID=UPI003D24B16F
MHHQKIIIAVDGHSSCGKSTLSKALARKLKYNYIDTGAMYRAVTLYAMRHQLAAKGQVDEKALVAALPDIHISFEFNAKEQKSDTCLNGENVENKIRELGVSAYVSPVATIKEVRQSMVQQQQLMGEQKGIVMDGRDIGTVVFPNAELKLFMTASPEVRARRRYDELIQKGQDVSFDEVLKNIEERDHIDSNRRESPLRKAADALVLDNSHMSREEQLQWVLEKAEEVMTLKFT